MADNEHTRNFDTQVDVRDTWRRFLDDLAPLRPDFYRFCAKLTGNPWDAEDLSQDTILRVFSALGKTDADIRNPRAYLIQTATNLWIDRMRRQAKHEALLELEAEVEPEIDEPELEANVAAKVLLAKLYPRERAALVLKDVLGFSLAEAASTLNTTVGAIKSALHRARARLNHPDAAPVIFAPDKLIVEQFMLAMANADIESLQDICATDLKVEMVGGAEMNTFEESKNFFAHAHFVMPEIGFGENPRWELADFEGEPLVIGLRTLGGIEGLNEIHRLEVRNSVITKIRCYCFCPDTLHYIASELGITALDRPYRSPG